MKLAYTATFEWDGYAPLYVADIRRISFDEKLADACKTWITMSRANAKKALESEPETLEMSLEACDDFDEILTMSGPFNCIAEMESDCFVTVTFGMLSVPDSCKEIYHITDSERFTANKNYAGLTTRDQANPISLS